MPFPFDLGNIIEGATGPIMQGLDDLFTSDEEREKARRLMQEVRQRLRVKLLDAQTQLMQRRADAVVAEANGESWLQRSWRPLTMLVFVALIVLHWLGVAGTELAPDVQQKVYTLIQLGIGGYVLGRSGEKMVRTGAEAVGRWKRGQEAKRDDEARERSSYRQQPRPYGFHEPPARTPERTEAAPEEAIGNRPPHTRAW